jgi:diguanylate cyclase (GGDEF)-like protein
MSDWPASSADDPGTRYARDRQDLDAAADLSDNGRRRCGGGGVDDERGLSIRDPLTGAYSRALLGPRLDEELSRASRSSTGCALFLFDIDYFKSINDAYGHGRGDEVLTALTERIHGLVRGYDVLFRYGGDEFVLLLPDTAKADAVRVALRLVEEVKATPYPGEPPLTVSVSLGVAAFPDDAADADGLLAAADRRNYLAKHRGRGCAVADDVESDARPASSRLLERDLPITAVREFLTRVMIGEDGALLVAGEPGAGHTRFLEEVIRAGRLRGFDVLTGTDLDADADAELGAGTAEEPARPVLVVVDAGPEPDDGARLAGLARRLRATGRPAVGVVHRAPLGVAAWPGTVDPGGSGLPVHDTVELLPWSTAALRIWLRTTLQGEPSPILIDWLASRAGLLPARLARELDRLAGREGLLRTDAGWTVAPAVLARSGRRRRPLPTPMTELVGRQRETAVVAQLLAAKRLVTLVGPGGIGKTRLSLAVAAATGDRFDDGVVFVPLETARTEDDVVAGLATALEVVEQPGRPLLDTLIEHLDAMAVLLVLDNLDHAEDAAAVVNAVLTAAPGVRALATSRERLGVYGEQAYIVPPLPLPDLDGLQPTAAGAALALAGSPALALFQSRARAAAYDFAVTGANLPAVAALCHRLDGLPLALELAAAHSDVLSPAEMLEQLTERLDLTDEGPRGLPGRQRTLRGAIDWSVDKLDPPERDVLIRLGIFAGGARLDAVAAVAAAALGTGDPGAIEKIMGRLVDKSLVGTESDGRTVRYTLLETVRAYAAERLAPGSHAREVRSAHALHFAAFAERVGDGLTGAQQTEWAARAAREYRNLRVAFDHCLGEGDPDTAGRLAIGLWRFWRNTGRLREGREWLDRLAAFDDLLPAAARGRARHAAAVLAAAQDDPAAAAALAAQALALAEEAGDRRTGAEAGNALGIAAMTAGRYAQARRYFTDSLAIWRDLDEPFGMAMAHGNLTMVALRRGAVDEAGEHATRCLDLERARGNTRGIMLGLLCLGEIELGRRAVTAAGRHLTEALALSHRASDVFGEAMALHLLGLAARSAGDHAAAVRQVAAALALRRDAEDRQDLAVSLDTLADLLTSPAGPRTAVPPVPAVAGLAGRLLGAADGLRYRHRLPTPTDGGGMDGGGMDGGATDGGATDGMADRAAVLDRLRAALDADTLALALATGRAASLDAVVDEALDHVEKAG